MTETSATPTRRNLSPALSSAIMGGLLVGSAAAVFAFAFIGPQTGYGFGGFEVLLVGLLGSVFGTVAGAVAGASETGEGEAVELPSPPRAASVAYEALPVEGVVTRSSAAQYT
ncbi:MAG: hypothetical protein AAF799_46820 [Myxococcota bacterium]